MALNTDLSGLFHIQKGYLLDVSGTDTLYDDKVRDLSTKLNALYGDFSTANVSSSAVLERQQEVGSIIDIERNRLEQKKQSIDNALIGKQRAISLNESYRMRQSQYMKMKIVVVIVLAIFIGTTILSRRYPIVPPFVISLINVIVILGGGIYCLLLYGSISSRSMMNYDELELKGPTVLSGSEVDANRIAAGKTGDLLGSINLFGCVGPKCCTDGDTMWDEATSKCVPMCATGFTWNKTTKQCEAAPANPANQSGFTTMDKRDPIAYSPNEYDKYSEVKSIK
jgi:hypothetical protein